MLVTKWGNKVVENKVELVWLDCLICWYVQQLHGGSMTMHQVFVESISACPLVLGLMGAPIHDGWIAIHNQRFQLGFSHISIKYQS